MEGDESDVARLGASGDSRAVEPLIRALGDQDKGARRADDNALGDLGDARAVEPLMRALGHSVTFTIPAPSRKTVLSA